MHRLKDRRPGFERRVLIGCLALALTVAASGCGGRRPAAPDVPRTTWEAFKKTFVDPDGRVRRPESDQDTVSEGQAYTLLRAVWMNDRETFDRCYAWTERHLSRSDTTGDALLAWHWQDGRVSDWMSASDADLDYALALVFAGSVWQGAPSDGPAYHERAAEVLRDILDRETLRLKDGRLVLMPWVRGPDEKVVVNPGYFAPAHFKVFFEFTGDARWKELTDSSYSILEALTRRLGDQAGIGLVPDWAELGPDGQWIASEGRTSGFGWDAVRMPYRVAWDHLWFGEPRAKAVLEAGMTDFLAREWAAKGVIRAGYTYLGKRLHWYDDPIFYAAAYFVFRAARPELASALADKVLYFLKKGPGGWVYRSADRYYTNSLSWMAEADRQGILKNLYQPERNAVT